MTTNVTNKENIEKLYIPFLERVPQAPDLRSIVDTSLLPPSIRTSSTNELKPLKTRVQSIQELKEQKWETRVTSLLPPSIRTSSANELKFLKTRVQSIQELLVEAKEKKWKRRITSLLVTIATISLIAIGVFLSVKLFLISLGGWGAALAKASLLGASPAQKALIHFGFGYASLGSLILVLPFSAVGLSSRPNIESISKLETMKKGHSTTENWEEVFKHYSSYYKTDDDDGSRGGSELIVTENDETPNSLSLLVRTWKEEAALKKLLAETESSLKKTLEELESSFDKTALFMKEQSSSLEKTLREKIKAKEEELETARKKFETDQQSLKLNPSLSSKEFLENEQIREQLKLDALKLESLEKEISSLNTKSEEYLLFKNFYTSITEDELPWTSCKKTHPNTPST